MMPLLVGTLAGLSVTLLVLALYDLATAPGRGVARELAELRSRDPSPFNPASRRYRQSTRQRLEAVVGRLGEEMVKRGDLDLEGWSKRLVQAGFWNSEAPRIFFGARVVLAASLLVAGILGCAALDARLPATLFAGLWLGVLGWLLPSGYVLQKRKQRRMDVASALADALDLLVACVEAGIGLNQALVRVADEIRNVSPALSAELVMVNLEIRAGTARDVALRNLADRTGLEDIENLASTLIQTERFGTSVGRALRVQADTLRQKRRQRAEEAAAKTTIKLVFPLVMFIFPSLFVVVLGPAAIQVVSALMELR
ncbi:MAG TPA: type II secretion system F family protein [Longimicrobiales bacterium]|nr:type II secretion system F family protein [Longimicrobiales bacterium]